MSSYRRRVLLDSAVRPEARRILSQLNVLRTEDRKRRPAGWGMAAAVELEALEKRELLANPEIEQMPPQTVLEGREFAPLFRFYDADGNGCVIHNATVDWGDGTGGSAPITIGPNYGEYFVHVGKVYPDNRPGNTPYTVTLTLTHQTDDEWAQGSVDVTVQNLAPRIQLSAPARADEGELVTVHFSARDAGSDTITGWTVDWGDGSNPDAGDPGGSPPGSQYAGSATAASHAYAQPGSYEVRVTAVDEDGQHASSQVTLDASFEQDGWLTNDFGGTDAANDTVLHRFVDDNGIAQERVLVVGHSNGNFALARFNLNGTPDTDFGASGRATLDLGASDIIARVAIQADGKIVAVGRKTSDFAVVRFHADGTPDPSFGGNGVVTTNFGGADAGVDVAIQPDGKIVVAGTASGNFAVARYLADGTLDPSFDLDGKQTADFGHHADTANAMALSPDGKITVAGYSPAGFDIALARFNGDGSPDATFDGDGNADGKIVTNAGSTSFETAYALALPDGKLLVGGTSASNFALLRYDEDGSLDASWDGDGILVTDFGWATDEVRDLAIQPDGKIVAAGTASIPLANNAALQGFGVARYNPDGTLDATFGSGGKLIATTSVAATGRGVTIGPDGGIFVAGTSNNNFAVARFHSRNRPLFVDSKLPTAPAGADRRLAAIPTGPRQILLQWTDPYTNETAYEVQRSTDGITFTPVATVASNATSHLVSGLEPQTTYTFRVRPVKHATPGAWYGTATATTQGDAGFYFNDFEGSVGSEWSHRSTSLTPVGSRRFLGQLGNQSVNLQFNELPSHDLITVEFDLFVIRSWDGNNGPDRWEFLADGDSKLLTTFSNQLASATRQSYPFGYQASEDAFEGSVERNTLGYKASPGGSAAEVPMDSVYRISRTFAHDDPDLTLTFRALGLDKLAAESWGIDNVSVSVNGTGEIDLTATARTDGDIDLVWIDDHVVETGFRLERSTDGQSWAVLGTTLPADTARYTDPVPARNTKYYYRVTALATSGVEVVSNVASAVSAPIDYTYVKVEEIEIPVDGSSVRTNITLEEGAAYQLRAEGDFHLGGYTDGNGRADADYAFVTDGQWHRRPPDRIDYGIGVGDRTRDGNKYPFWGDYDAEHEYAISFTGDGAPLVLEYHDDHYANNGDSTLKVWLYRGVPAGTVTLDASPDEPNKRIVLTWNDSLTEETGYVVERKEPGWDWVEIFRTGPNPGVDPMVYNDPNPKPGVLHTYRVRPLHATGSYGPSNEDTALLVGNRAPQFLPHKTAFQLPGPANAATGLVKAKDLWTTNAPWEQGISVDPLGLRAKAKHRVAVTLPAHAIPSPAVDIFLAVDHTASFEQLWPELSKRVVEMVTRLTTAFPEVSFGFGVGHIKEYAGIPSRDMAREIGSDAFVPSDPADQYNRPFVLTQPIITPGLLESFTDSDGDGHYDVAEPFVAGSHFVDLDQDQNWDEVDEPFVDQNGNGVFDNYLEALKRALIWDIPGAGGPRTAAVIEALYQIATGAGFDGNGNGSTTDAGPAGLLSTQWAKSTSGDVPAFATYQSDRSTNLAMNPAGSLGGVGFRKGALPIIVVATDASTEYQPHDPERDVIVGADGVTIPMDRFTGHWIPAYEYRDYEYKGTMSSHAVSPGGGRGATIQGTVDALAHIGAKVIGLGAQIDWSTEMWRTWGESNPIDPNMDPRQLLEALAIATGAVSRQAGAIDRGIDGDEIEQGDPLYFPINRMDVSSIVQGIMSGVTAAITGADFNITVVPSDSTIRIGNEDEAIKAVAAGQEATFDLLFEGDGLPHYFDLRFVDEEQGRLFGTIPVTLGSIYEYELSAKDEDGDHLTYHVLEMPTGASFDGRKITWSPTTAGSYEFVVSVTDGSVVTTDTFWVTVAVAGGGNADPVLQTTTPLTAATVGTEYTYDVNASDPEGKPLSYYLGSAPDGMSMNTATASSPGLRSRTRSVAGTSKSLSSTLIRAAHHRHIRSLSAGWRARTPLRA